MTYYKLSGDIACCMASGRCILLDVTRDRYLSPPPSAARAVEKVLASRPLGSEDIARLRGLLEAGYMTALPPGEAWSFRPPAVSAPRGSRFPRPGNPGIALMSAVASNLLWSALSLKYRGLDRTLRSLSNAQKGAEPAEADQRLDDILAGFNWSALFFASQDRCLLRSVAVKRMLARRGFPCTLVIGVIGMPFSAHCWVQRDDELLVDDVDHIRAFSPIFHLS